MKEKIKSISIILSIILYMFQSTVVASEKDMPYLSLLLGNKLTVYFYQTNEPNFDFLSTYDGKENIAGKLSPEGGLSKVTYVSSEYSMTIDLADDGLPKRAVIDELQVLFRNYTDTHVDLIFLNKNGESYTEKNVPLDQEMFENIKVLQTSNQQRMSNLISTNNQNDFVYKQEQPSLLPLASFIVSGTMCVIGLASAPTGVGAAIAYIGCGGAVASAANMLLDCPNCEIVSDGADYATCIAGGSGCPGVLVDLIGHVSDSTENAEEAADSAIMLSQEIIIKNGLIWQRNDAGTLYNWDQALNYCSNLSLGGYSDWYLPDTDQLNSLVVCTNGTPTPLLHSIEGHPHNCGDGNNELYRQPTIDSVFNCENGAYWTSNSHDTNNLGNPYVDFVYFLTGSWDSAHRDSSLNVRCVR